tara:strand:- start:58537 stop:58875 length:339 start_codon:yes stop_codon:yes gene_type:complete
MIPSFSGFLSPLVVCVAVFSVGCQSVGSQQSAAVLEPPDTIRTVKADTDTTDSGPVILLNRDIQARNQKFSEDSSGQTLWSKLSSPTRFLLPRTDSDSSAVLEDAQGLDDGF